jgi:HPt (histidine-containing phosphotransfer) domain-containing protein
LLISDLGLPDGSGHDLMRQLRQRGHSFPGIALSGYGQEEDIQRSREAGFAAHLTKPASHEAVVEAIAAVTPGKAPSADAPAIGSEPPSQVGLPPLNAESSVFNLEEAIRRCFRREEMFQRMAENFFKDVDRLFPQMRAALQKGDIAQVGHLGHRLKGTIVHLAAQHAEDAALRVEQFVKHPVQPAEAEEAINALERECETLKLILGKWHYATVSQDETGNG